LVPPPPPVPVPSGPIAPTGAIAIWVVLWTMWQVGGEMRIWNESELLGRRVHAAEPEALDAAVETYSSLADRSSLGFGLWPARQPLREALAMHVDRVILDFRQPEPTVREMQWKQARAWAAKALELGADDSLRARFLLCDAHAKRIDGDAAMSRGQIDRANRLLNEADSQFREAARLSRGNPDAWLGLLRLHAGTRGDPDLAQADLNEAARRGWTPGPRDYFLIGEASRTRAETLEKGCDDRRTGELVKECLAQARTLQKKAIEWYDKAEGLSIATRGGTQSQKAVERLDARIEVLDESSLKGLGLDLLKLAVETAVKHAEGKAAPLAKAGTPPTADTPPKAADAQASKP